MKKIYEHIINVIKQLDTDSKYTITCQRYDESKPNQLGVILESSRNDEVCISGETEWESLKLEVHITCENSETGIFDNIDFLRKFVDLFEISDSEVEGLEILGAWHLGSKARPSYTNGYGLQVCKCVIDFNYSLA